jgi:hypothetical protein
MATFPQPIGAGEEIFSLGPIFVGNTAGVFVDSTLSPQFAAVSVD